MSKKNLIEPPVFASSYLSLAVQIHIFHEDYLDRVIRQFKNDINAHLYFSVKNKIFKNILEKELTQAQILDVRVVPNKGRNFAPLFVEFGEELGKYDLVLHLHSKSHQKSYKRKKWANSLWDNLLLDTKRLDTVLAYFNSNTNLGLYYSRDFRWYPQSVGWSGTEEKSKHYFPELVTQIEGTTSLKFPIGGMFLTRGTNISYISRVINEWNLVPSETSNQEEISQGLTLEHSLERLISQVNLHNGFETLIYDCNFKSFIIETADTNFETK